MAISKTKLTELDEARSLQLQALRVRLDRFGPDSLDVAASRESIAVTLGNMKLWDEAVEHSSEALDALTPQTRR